MPFDKFEKLPAWKQEQVVNALAEPKAFEYSFPHNEVTPVVDLDSIDWTQVVGVQKSETGSEGVLFVELEGKKAVIVKAPSHAAAEAFGTALCKRLGLECPALRVLARRSDEAISAIENLVRADEKRPEIERKVGKFLATKGPLLVIEYLQDAPELADRLGPEARTWGEDLFLSGGKLSSTGIGTMRQLGALLAFDMLINNFDRLPCIWENDGNPGNVLINSKGKCLSIDNMVACLPPTKTAIVEPYLKKVEATVAAVAAAGNTEVPEFYRIRKFFRSGAPGHGWPGLGVDVGEEGTLEVQTGFLDLVKMVLEGNPRDDMEALKLDEIQEMHDMLLPFLPEDFNLAAGGSYLYGFEVIHPAFCDAVIAAGIRACCPTIVCATLGDQPFHGSLAEQRGFGKYLGMVGTKGVNPESLAKAIKQVTTDPAIAAAAREIGGR